MSKDGYSDGYPDGYSDGHSGHFHVLSVCFRQIFYRKFLNIQIIVNTINNQRAVAKYGSSLKT